MDTIAAISSGLTESGIGIIRISGPDSFSVINKILINSRGNCIDLSESHRVHHGYIVDYVSRETLDEVLVINMAAPHTYTGEDTVEIDCHGGTLVMKRILQNVISAGARLAEPGEFTKTAFLNGRLDLSQAEAVIDLINAKNIKSAEASVKQLKGEVSERVRDLRKEIILDSAYIEAALDDPEHYNLDGFASELLLRAEKWKIKLNRLINTYERGRIIREGIDTVIIGKPNVGKSSLLNALLGEEISIVTDIPGTTRDILTEHISFDGLSLNIKDTAGIRDSGDIVERKGIEKALNNASSADLILCVLDGSSDLEPDDMEILKKISGMKAHKIIIFNKTDLGKILDINTVNESGEFHFCDYIYMSALSRYGLDQIYGMISGLFSDGSLDYNDEVVITSVRHLDLLKKAYSSVNELISSIHNSLSEDFYTIDMMDAYRSLGEIIGEEVGEDLINEIFSRFCIGK